MKDESDDRQNLQEENQFLKMKLMLEHGAQFHTNESSDLTAEIENLFLKNVMEFEKKFSERKQVKLFDKIGAPTDLLKVEEIPEDEMVSRWDSLHELLQKHGIELNVFNPEVGARELYRFVTEELFECETDDVDLPGYIQHFIYDEFHPDPKHESKMLMDEFFKSLFTTGERFFEAGFVQKGFEFNGRVYDEIQDFIDHVKEFRFLYKDLTLKYIHVGEAEMKDDFIIVRGNYHALGTLEGDRMEIQGCFRGETIKSEGGFFQMRSMYMKGFEL